MGKKDYIDLKINGRLFPHWVMMNFKKYKLDEIITKEGEDPQKKSLENRKMELKNYQTFISAFLDFRSPYKNLLVYHGLGSGKTASTINVYNVLYNYTPGWNVYVLLPASLRGQWIEELEKWLSKDNKDERFGNIKFISYDSPIADSKFIDEVRQSDGSKKSLFIFDECHNFIRNVYNNLTSKTGKRAQVIYDYILNEKKMNNDTRVLLLSGTPAVNTPYELALIYNLLRPDIFPKSEEKFNDLYISNNRLRKSKKNMFIRRILGLTSYYIGSTPDLFAEKKTHYIDLPMTEYQYGIYKNFEEIEEKIASVRGPGGGSTTYRTYTRQSSNFVFPKISARVNGDNRPRPRDFKISEKDAIAISEGRSREKLQVSKTGESIMRVTEYENTIQNFLSGLDNFLSEQHQKDKQNGHTIFDDFKIFAKDYKMKYTEFTKKHKKVSNLLRYMRECSIKMTAIIFYMLKSKGPVLFYSNYVKMEGLEIFKILLKHCHYTDFNAKENGKDYYRYVEYHGSIDSSLREKNRIKFNDKANIDGRLIKLIMISPAGSEGISLKNVRQVHVLEPYWNEVRIEQLIGRALRAYSHIDLDPKDRIVDIYRYKALRMIGAESTKPSTDEEIDMLANKKDELIKSFLKTIKESAVDCELHKAHNMMEQKYTCFKFDQNSLFRKNPGPAYKHDLFLDTKLDNGLYSSTSIEKEVVTYEVKAVIMDDDDNTDDSKKYWFEPKSGVFYDYELEYPIGKVAEDEYGIPKKIDEETYIIKHVIQVPVIKHRSLFNKDK